LEVRVSFSCKVVPLLRCASSSGTPFPTLPFWETWRPGCRKKGSVTPSGRGLQSQVHKQKARSLKKPRSVVSTRQRVAPRPPVVALPATPVRRALRAVAKFRENATVRSQKTNSKVRKFTETENSANRTSHNPCRLLRWTHKER